MDDFVNSIADSTHDGDMVAYEPVPDELDSVLAIQAKLGIDPEAVHERVKKDPYEAAVL